VPFRLQENFVVLVPLVPLVPPLVPPLDPVLEAGHRLPNGALWS
jgi:hypothetical protein